MAYDVLIKNGTLVAKSTFAATCLFLAGCNHTGTSLPLNPMNDAESIVVIVRNGGDCHYSPLPCSFEITLDGKEVATVADKTFTRFSVPKGSHQMDLRWPPLSTCTTEKPGTGCSRVASTLAVELHGSETRYFLISGRRLFMEIPASEFETNLRRIAGEGKN